MGVKWAVLSWVMEKKGKNKHGEPCLSWGALGDLQKQLQILHSHTFLLPLAKGWFPTLTYLYLGLVLSGTHLSSLALSWGSGWSTER